MAIPAYVELYDQEGAKIEGGVTIKGREGSVEALSFYHDITIPADSHTGQLTGTGKHDAMVFTKEVDKSSPYLFSACCRGQTLDKVVIHWYDVNENGGEQEYFRHELKGVKIVAVQTAMHNVKKIGKERHPHLEQVALRYAIIKWLHLVSGAECSS